MYEFYLKIVHVLWSITNYYTHMHYFYYKYVFGGDRKFEDFHFTDFNVGIWILTIFSIVICFALIFIPLKKISPGQRRLRKTIKYSAPIGILLAPLPLMIAIVVQAYMMVGGTYRFVKNIIISLR